MSNYYVWLDAGHSRMTCGKRNTVANPKFYEYEFNNDLAVKVKKRLEEHGVVAYLTNTTPEGNDIALTTRANVANNKWKSLGKPSNAIFVSIHGNASTGAWSQARGVEVYHANNASSKSKNLASILTKQIYDDIKLVDKNFKQRGVKSANFTVIYKANMPSVLIENAFYDNKEDLYLMQNHRSVFVEAIVKGVCKYFGIAYKTKTIEQPKQETTEFKKYLVRCNTDGLNCRKGAGTSYAIDRVINKGTVVTIVEEKMNGNTKWLRTVSNYWISAKYTTFVKFI